MASVVKNFQITVNNVHVRYEETFSDGFKIACGLCLQSFSMATTNKYVQNNFYFSNVNRFNFAVE